MSCGPRCVCRVMRKKTTSKKWPRGRSWCRERPGFHAAIFSWRFIYGVARRMGIKKLLVSYKLQKLKVTFTTINIYIFFILLNSVHRFSVAQSHLYQQDLKYRPLSINSAITKILMKRIRNRGFRIDKEKCVAVA